jgi:NDP-sugar pyrophosphorylase family protein
LSEQAVILAGGLGTRLYPLTRTVPKPMVPVAGKPYLHHQLDELRRQGFSDIVLLTGYLSEQIEEYFGDGHALDLSIRYSREASPVGTGGALRDAASLLAPEFVVIYGDSYLPIYYADVLTRLRASDADALVVVYDNRGEDTSVKNNIAADAEGYVCRYDKQDPAGLDYVDAGVLALRRAAVDLIPSGRPVSFEQEIFPRLIDSRKLIAYPTPQRFYDIGTPDRLKTIEQLFTR